MNIIDILRAKRRLLSFGEQVVSCYYRYGETTESVAEIEHLSADWCNSNKAWIDNCFARFCSSRGSFSEQPAEPLSTIIVQRPSLKMSLHAIPPGHTVPAHLHPSTLSMVYVLQGDIYSAQHSFNPGYFRFHGTQHSQRQQQKVLLMPKNRVRLIEGQLKAGLCHLNNIHTLKAGKSVSCYLTLHIKVRHSNNPLRQWISGLLLTGGALFAQMSAFAQSTRSVEVVALTQYVDHFGLQDDHCERELETQSTARQTKLDQARKLVVNSQSDAQLYEAAQLFKQEAIRGDAEAQYWLGILYLEGRGITENSSEALHWISASADQDYPPAREVLDYMLVTDDALNC